MVDFGSSMFMLSNEDSNWVELDTVRLSRRPTLVMTANGSVDTNDEATVHVKDLNLFLTVQLFEDTPLDLFLDQFF